MLNMVHESRNSFYWPHLSTANIINITLLTVNSFAIKLGERMSELHSLGLEQNQYSTLSHSPLYSSNVQYTYSVVVLHHACFSHVHAFSNSVLVL